MQGGMHATVAGTIPLSCRGPEGCCCMRAQHGSGHKAVAAPGGPLRCGCASLHAAWAGTSAAAAAAAGKTVARQGRPWAAWRGACGPWLVWIYGFRGCWWVGDRGSDVAGGWGFSPHATQRGGEHPPRATSGAGGWGVGFKVVGSGFSAPMQPSSTWPPRATLGVRG